MKREKREKRNVSHNDLLTPHQVKRTFNSISYQISECLSEKDISYRGNDVNDGTANKQPTVESCRTSCASIGADYFDFVYGLGKWMELDRLEGRIGECYCKNSNAGRSQLSGVTAGETCRGRSLLPCHQVAPKSASVWRLLWPLRPPKSPQNGSKTYKQYAHGYVGN